MASTWLSDVRHASKTSLLRLVSSREVSDASPDEKRYITLSHCWGERGSKERPVLKSANEQERYEIGISIEKYRRHFEMLSQSPNGSRVISQYTSSLQTHSCFHVFRRLWVDSLCIIQDSDAHWRREVSLMDRAYKQGYFKISADWNVDARDGLSSPRSPMRVQILPIGLPEIGQVIQLAVHERDIFDWVNTAPLSQRAWVFQERHLARRICTLTSRRYCGSAAPKHPSLPPRHSQMAHHASIMSVIRC